MAPRIRRPHESGWTVVEVLLVAIVVGLLLALAIPNLHRNRIRNNEAAAVRALGEIGRAQELLRRTGAIDGDADGRGEYGFLQELSGEKNPRSPVAGREGGSREIPAPLPQFYLKVSPGGEAVLSGYVYRVLLPGEGGRAVEERGGGSSLRTTAPVDPGLAAETWCAYAWPADERGPVPVESGERTFMVNQAGVVIGARAPYRGAGEGRGPAPGAAFAGAGPPDSITGAAALGTAGRDGLLWEVVR